MLNRIFKIIVLILAIVGIFLGVSITIKKQLPENNQRQVESQIFSKIQTKSAEITEFYTYGRAFNLNGIIDNVSKDNFESAKLVITDGLEYEKEYNVDYSLIDGKLAFSSKLINSEIILDDLDDSNYYILLRLKLNNSIDPKYYSLKNVSKENDIEYYTLSSEDKPTRKAIIDFVQKEYEGKMYDILTVRMEEATLPDDVYDIVIDAGHGGKDTGVVSGKISESNITLEYAKLLEESLENKGYKVKLTRDENNTDSYTTTNMYDQDGRISIACSSKAKLMISFHVNDNPNNLSGFEIYCPCKSDLTFASEMAKKIKEYSTINYSNNTTYKQLDGVYVNNFTQSIINDFKVTAQKKGYEPYPITINTPYLYTSREVGGVATGAYVDGRNTQYSKNEYYDSNQGIECYQIELGYIKTDLDVIVNEKNSYIRAITEAICDKF